MSSTENLSGSVSNLAIEEKKSEVVKSTKINRAPSAEEEEEEDTGETVQVHIPRKGQEAPFEEANGGVEAEEEPIITPQRRAQITGREIREPLVLAEHGFVESASREPRRPPELAEETGRGTGREARIQHETEKALWAAGEAEERFPAKAYTCRFCGLTYAYLTTLKAHERVHDVEEPYKCGKCSQSFRFYSELDYHLRSHKEQKQYKCKCGRSFSLYTDLIHHRCEMDALIEREPSPEPIHPPLKESALLAHAASAAKPLYRYPDTRRKPYICQYCGKSYAESRDLKYHMYSHRGERAFNVRSTSYARCLPDDKIWKSDLDYYDWD